ncbi:MAG: DUF4369 domain-containing protein [Hymenobacter sp.]|nr:MAG: DUF4369 domain-containing protein [Hymenobacter sp.]
MNYYFLGFLALAPWLAQAQSTYTYLIKGKVGHLTAPAKVYLVYGPQVLDSAALKNGQFELKGTTQWPHSAELVLERQGRLKEGLVNKRYVKSPDRASLFLEPGPVVVASADSLVEAHVSGGQLTGDYQRLQTSLKPVISQLKTARSQAQFDAASRQYGQAELAFVKANPTSWVSLEVLQQLRMFGPP